MPSFLDGCVRERVNPTRRGINPVFFHSPTGKLFVKKLPSDSHGWRNRRHENWYGCLKKGLRFLAVYWALSASLGSTQSGFSWCDGRISFHYFLCYRWGDACTNFIGRDNLDNCSGEWWCNTFTSCNSAGATFCLNVILISCDYFLLFSQELKLATKSSEETVSITAPTTLLTRALKYSTFVID